MKLTAVFVTLALYALEVQGMLMTYQEFLDYIAGPCYDTSKLQTNEKLTYGQVHPVANSMENFISLVERIEKNNAMGSSASLQQDALTVANMLLRRFSIQDVVDSEKSISGNMQLTEAGRIRMILSAIQKSQAMPNIDSIDQTLTKDEKCSLYFMLSHSINKTHRAGDEDMLQQAPPLMAIPVTTRPREQGVVSLHGDQDTAISLSPVVAGILFGGRYENETVRSLISRLTQFIPGLDLSKVSQKIINPLYAATLSGLIGYTAVEYNRPGEALDPTRLSGKWDPDSPLCMMDYRFNINSNANESDVTVSMLRGAVDGLLLGLYGKRFFTGNPKFALSDILREYYSPHGLPIESIHTRLTFCNRNALFNELRKNQNDVLKEQIAAYAEAFHIVSAQSLIPEGGEPEFEKKVEWALGQMNALADSQQFQLTPDELTLCSPGKKVAESPADVFVVMESNGDEVQKETIGHLGTLMDLHFTNLNDDSRRHADGSSMSLLSNIIDSQTKRLRVITFNSSNPSCPGCRLAFPDDLMRFGTSATDSDVISKLTDMVVGFKEDRSSWTATPARVVVYFKTGNVNLRSTRDLEWAVRDLRQRLPDLCLIAVTARKESVTSLVKSVSEDVVVPNPNMPRETARAIKGKIDGVPAILQYPECNIRPSYEGSPSATYTGFVTPGYYQYWAMYPQYFLKSYNIRFKITSDSVSDLSVCYSRATNHPEDDKRNCNTTRAAGNGIEIAVRNPCKGLTVHNCAPMYFTIFGGDINKAMPGVDPNLDVRCIEAGCTAPDQIKFTIGHTGVSCNGAMYLLSSPFQLLLTSLLVLYNILK